MNNVKAATAKETHPKCRELADNYIDFIERLSEQEALTRRFFIIYEYETISSREKTIDDIAIEMEEMARKIRGNLAACGNEVVTPQNEEYFQAEILYQFYNRQSCVTEQLADRVLRVTDDVMKGKGLVEGVDEYPDIPIPDYIAPRGVDFTNPDYFICDGLYQTILYVQRNGYPTAVNGGWLSSIIESSDGVDIDIILRRQSKANIRDKVALKLKLNRIKVNSREDTDTDFETIEGAVQSAKFIKDCLANGEDFYYMYTFITVTAATKEGLDRKMEVLYDLLYSRGLSIKQVKFRLESAFRIVTPALCYEKELQEFAAQNVMTFGVAKAHIRSQAVRFVMRTESSWESIDATVPWSTSTFLTPSCIETVISLSLVRPAQARRLQSLQWRSECASWVSRHSLLRQIKRTNSSAPATTLMVAISAFPRALRTVSTSWTFALR